VPLARRYLEFYNTHSINEDINGFYGYEQAKEILIIKREVNGISEK
jgi:hypothetical protein